MAGGWMYVLMFSDDWSIDPQIYYEIYNNAHECFNDRNYWYWEGYYTIVFGFSFAMMTPPATAGAAPPVAG